MNIIEYISLKIPRIAYMEYLKVKRKSKAFNKKQTDKALIINCSNPEIYHRYFYGLIKFFSIEGYTIYFPTFNFKYFKHNVHTKYKSPWNQHQLIYQEGLICLEEAPNKSKNSIELNENNLNPDYFTCYFKTDIIKTNSYHIPISMHPKFYNNNYWDKEVSYLSKRKRSIFMVGNFGSAFYSGYSATPFNSDGRIEVFQHLNKEKILREFNTRIEFDDFLKSNDDDNVCIILDSNKIRIDISELREVLNNFYFYLALPGSVMPFSHNIIEALSVGSILIIHEEYAKMMSPELKHLKNAIIYNDLEDLTNKINLAYNLNEKELFYLRDKAKEYYNLHLTPKAVVNKIVTGNYDMMYLLAEHLSVDILEKNLKNEG
ncbi:hypothetical protein ACFQ0I_11000 [Mariniflexile aquimaris]|uniref:Uncharacterized protein n=1 Tax=Mariniflexile aquimaris TaxID=881009 RepID=A0ABW3BTA1_9FLAO